jgi:hypothetical protein
MKNKFLLLLLLPLSALFFTLSSFDKANHATESVELSETEAASGVGENSQFNYRLDTLTNTESNILTIGRRDNSVWNTVTNPTNFLSLYTFDVKVKTANLSGTHSVKVVLDGSNVSSGTSTGWVGLDSLTTTAQNTIQLRTTDATATRYRLRISGTGTMSSTYQVWMFCKKKN